MPGMLDRLFGRDRKSAHLAKERLKLVLVHDRTDISPGVMELMKDDLIAAISRHIDIDASDVRIEMTDEGRVQRLIADIPLRPSRRRS
ncbi:MAG: cell division topological specificity factor MinE [Anaerolineae bacterium UTCFX2]|jgi:cell division topological specificity factor|nr:cell division topological specificity factor MinE [Anaerolineae bacterium]MCZ7551144.1 cell division topological specificity factor MinE [Anaerolineales bacterium]OQY90930.1 MAG: cell division topological specificity factor MinE [Anaerolineae bacterium UTCFX2]